VQEKTTSCWGGWTTNPQHVAFRTQVTARGNSERDSFALRTAANGSKQLLIAEP
jgi:hypothetical protein